MLGFDLFSYLKEWGMKDVRVWTLTCAILFIQSCVGEKEIACAGNDESVVGFVMWRIEIEARKRSGRNTVARVIKRRSKRSSELNKFKFKFNSFVYLLPLNLIPFSRIVLVLLTHSRTLKAQYIFFWTSKAQYI
jgi:hypothetical protein